MMANSNRVRVLSRATGGRSAAMTVENPGAGKRVKLRRLALICFRVLSCTVVSLLFHFWPASTYAQAIQTFYVRGLASKCLTFDAKRAVVGGPVFLSACDNGPGQQIGVHETVPKLVNEAARPGPGKIWPVQRYEVVLMARNLCIGAEANVLVNNVPLVLQECANSPAQVFALDGDSIILAANRDLVAQVRSAVPANGTPIVLNYRNLADSEFWTFSATDGSGHPPTDGFVSVSQAKDLCSAVQNARWGMVIQIVPDDLLDVTNVCSTPLEVPGGVTIRGNRKGVLLGPQVSLTSSADGAAVFDFAGDDVRITGLRILGPSRKTDSNQPSSRGIQIWHNRSGSIVDHNDVSNFADTAVDFRGPDSGDGDNKNCQNPLPGVRVLNGRAVRNFVHHNQEDGIGYGIATGQDGYTSIEGNTFVSNRHAIAADGTQMDSYNAVYNLVLSAAPSYERHLLGHDVEHDFDMHGSAGSGSSHVGGIGGRSVLISGNTFLGTNRANFVLRGKACADDQFVNNISEQEQNHAVQWWCAQALCPTPPAWLTINSKFSAPDPTQNLGVGDFDGDGKDDLFLATGTAWYYAPAGNAEWRFLNAQTDTIDNLLFGDFDGDGRTDVFTQHGRDWLVSWGGISPWEKINESDARMSDFVIGDFVGDSRSDVFYASGTQWFVSDGGVGPFVPYAASSYRVSNLRFGDFDGDGKTDVMGVVDNQWMVVYANQDHQWKKLNLNLTNDVQGLVVADFDGNKKADIARIDTASVNNQRVSLQWQVSRDGVGPWTPLLSIPVTYPLAVIGHFDDVRGSDILFWEGNALFIASSGTAALQRQSRQDMR